jgi:drug/metabolite transporter (DMT)-like permease
MPTRNQAIAIALLAAILYSSKAIFVKVAYRIEPIDSVTLLFLRMVFSLPFYLFSFWRLEQKDATKTVGWVGVKGGIYAGFLFFISALLDFIGLKHVSAGIERLILFMYPSLVLVFSFFFFGISIKKYQYGALFLTYFGILISFFQEATLLHYDNSFLYGVLMVFLCSITYALYVVVSGETIKKIGSERFTNYAMFAMFVFAFVQFILFYPLSHLFDFQPSIYAVALAMAVLSTVVPSYLMAYSIKQLGANDSAIVNSIGPVSTILQAYFILGEPIHLAQLLGTIMVVWGILWIGKKS